MKVKKVKELLEENKLDVKNIIDIRESYELKSGKINGSKNIPMNKLLKHPERFLNKEDTYYLMCQSGTRSFSTFITLKLKKFKVKNISGGYLKWKENI